MSIYNNHKKFLSIAGAGNGTWIGAYQIHDLDKLYANGFLSASTTYYFSHLYSVNCMAVCGWESNKFAYAASSTGYKVSIYVKN